MFHCEALTDEIIVPTWFLELNTFISDFFQLLKQSFNFIKQTIGRCIS